MAFNLFDNSMIKSPQLLSSRMALVRALMARQHPRDMWDGINNFVAAISSRIAQDQLGKAETAEQLNPKASLAPLVQALKNRQLQDTRAIKDGFPNPWSDTGRASWPNTSTSP